MSTSGSMSSSILTDGFAGFSVDNIGVIIELLLLLTSLDKGELNE